MTALAVVEQTAPAPADPAAGGGGGDVVAISVAAIGALGVIATAFAPALTARVQRGAAPSTAPPTPAETAPTPPGAANAHASGAPATLAPDPVRDSDVFDALEESIRDLRAQRDAAQAELARVHHETSLKIETLREELGEARIALARLQAGRYNSP